MTTSAINTAMRPLEWALLITLSVLWGGSFFFVGVAVKELPTFTVVVCRVTLAALILLALVRLTDGRMPRDTQVWRAFLVMGFLNNVVPFSTIVWAQASLASGLAAILNATTPLFTVVVAHYFAADERLTGGRIAGVLLGVIGVAVMVGGEIAGTLGRTPWAELACLLAALSYAFAGIYGRRFRALGVAPMATAAGQVTASSLMLIPVMLIVERPWTLPVPGPATLFALLGVAALSTAAAYVIYFRLLASAGATNLLLVTFLIPVSAILLGTLALGEQLLPRHLLGMGMIGLGLAAIDGRLWQWISVRHKT